MVQAFIGFQLSSWLRHCLSLRDRATSTGSFSMPPRRSPSNMKMKALPFWCAPTDTVFPGGLSCSGDNGAAGPAAMEWWGQMVDELRGPLGPGAVSQCRCCRSAAPPSH